MKKKIPFKNHWAESSLFRSRAAVALVIVGIGLLGLVLRLVYLQVFSNDHYTTLAENNRITLVPLPPPRGVIYDRNGVVLAENRPALSLEIIPEEVKDLNGTLSELTKILPISEEDIALFHRLRRQERTFESIPLRFHLTPEEVARFSIEKYRFPGVEIVAGMMRHYPHGESFSHVLGYVGRINEQEIKQLDPQEYRGTQHMGKVGIEHFYEKVLHGQVGYSEIEVNAMGRLVRVLSQHPPKQGNTLHLTLDSALQKTAYDALAQHRGAVVVMAPKTGEILAFVSKPGFEPNEFARGLTVKEYQALQNNPDRPLFNRALRGQYPPGSTIKPLVAFTALEAGVITPNYTIIDPGWYSFPHSSHRYRDWRKEGHGYVNVYKAIAESCDIFFYDTGNRLGIERLSKGLKNFGLGTATGIDITGEVSGLVPSTEWKERARKQPWYGGETIITAIGQGYNLATPLQLVQAAAIVANRGIAPKPHVLKAIETTTGEYQSIELPLETKVTALNPENWDIIVQGMTNVVHAPGGTAYRISRKMPYTMAAKTGTAQVVGLKQNERYNEKNTAEHLRDHTLFIAFAPTEAPEIAIGLIVENSHGSPDVAKQVFDVFFSQKANTTP